MEEVIPGLYVSDKESAADIGLLRQHRISAIVSLGCEPPSGCVNTHLYKNTKLDNFSLWEPTITPTNHQTQLENTTSQSSYPSSMSFLCFPNLLDSPESPLLPLLSHTSAFIATSRLEGRAVCVHCVYGQSRSVSVIAAYLLHEIVKYVWNQKQTEKKSEKTLETFDDHHVGTQKAGEDVESDVMAEVLADNPIIKEEISGDTHKTTHGDHIFLSAIFSLLRKRNINVNPGFLCQLHVLEYHILCHYSLVDDEGCSVPSQSHPFSFSSMPEYQLLCESDSKGMCVGLKGEIPMSHATEAEINCYSKQNEWESIIRELFTKDTLFSTTFQSSSFATSDILCQCGHILCNQHDLLAPLDHTHWLVENEDPFWKGYLPTHSITQTLNHTLQSILTGHSTTMDAMNSKRRRKEDKVVGKEGEKKGTAKGGGKKDGALIIPYNGLIFIAPPRGSHSLIMSPSSSATNAHTSSAAAAPSEGSLLCKKCLSVCGVWKKRGLGLCNGFLVTDLYALSSSLTKHPQL